MSCPTASIDASVGGVMTAASMGVIAGTPVGGLQELTQLDVQGELKRRVFAPQ